MELLVQKCISRPNRAVFLTFSSSVAGALLTTITGLGSGFSLSLILWFLSVIFFFQLLAKVK
jgi:hypothetical protein